MEDLRLLLGYFGERLPTGVEFINIQGLLSYLRTINLHKVLMLEDLVEILEPYIPMVISEKDLQKLFLAQREGNISRLTELEGEFVARSKFIFLNSALLASAYAEDTDWENIKRVCRKIRSMKI